MDLNTQRNQNIKANKSNVFIKILNLLSIKEASELVRAEDIDDRENLLECIKNARREWMSANTNFEYAVENDLVDYFTYKIKACEVRYEYLLKIAKERGITLDFMNA